MWRKAVPNAFSSANLMTGLFAIALSLEGWYTFAAMAILIGMVFDALDGNMARLLNASSEFGKQMDALCDLISFGTAPVFLLYMQIYEQKPAWPLLLPLLAFPICGALRLARFNTTPTPPGGGFIGIPITAAGGILAICSLSWPWFGVTGILLFTAFLSFLMVSTIRYPDIKSIAFLKTKTGIIIALLTVITFAWFFWEWLFLPLVGYAFLGWILQNKK